MRLFSITLAGSLLLAIISIASLSDGSSSHAIGKDSFAPLEITKQFAEAEEDIAAVLTPVLIASWTSVATSSASSSGAETNLSTPKTEGVSRLAKAPPTAKPTTAVVTTKTTPAPKTKAVTPSTLPSQGGYSLTEVRKQIHSRTNTARANNNLGSLSTDGTLTSIAQKRSEDMIAKNYFSHTSPGGCDLVCRFEGLSYSAYGENLAEYYEFSSLTESELAATFINMWLKSTGHRRNLLSSGLTREGVGVAMKGNRVVVTVVFGTL